MRIARGVLAVAGLALMLAGARLMWVATPSGAPFEVAVWLGGALVAHDVVLASLVMLAGLAVPRGPGRGAVRGGLVVAGCATLVVSPILLRPGAPRNPTVLSLDYGSNLAALLAAVAVVTAGVALGGRLLAARRARALSARPDAGR
ncbi:hypothetical protein SAMN06297387_103244 [Streptomyces zhaozhouensis]|uniref:Uncharacterized protein n=1 Tax=Streptomyces zhaozhouensis TaxID=1300267 RepID=A0A286DSF7_9ACTN|nr:hypothetical protein [Streptomyces zhaozhouensis]SOD61588.1 hypothetical protein SAMN06297387_103244 [Streptomyces zhaozhouensis]